MTEFTDVSDWRGNHIGIAFNHHDYASPNNAVFISLGKHAAMAYRNDWVAVSIEQAKELRAKLDEIIERFEKNQPKPPKNSEILAELGVGAVIRVNDEENVWIRNGNGRWYTRNTLVYNRTGEVDEFFDISRAWTINILSEGVKL